MEPAELQTLMLIAANVMIRVIGLCGDTCLTRTRVLHSHGRRTLSDVGEVLKSRTVEKSHGEDDPVQCTLAFGKFE